MIIYIDENYPKVLVEMLTRLHTLPNNHNFEIVYRTDFDNVKHNKPCVFLFDQSIKRLDLTTQQYYNDGLKVFAFKLLPKTKNDPFEFTLVVLSLWPKFIKYMIKDDSPFVCSFTSTGRHTIKT